MDSSRALPTGVVTFLLTDIEGSTRRWEAEPEAMREALLRHDSIVTTCVRRLNGHVVKSKGEGDSVFAVFRHARDAITAALVLQCALNAEQWPTREPIRVRMALHTGQVELRDGDYYGPTVNRCARLRALGRGGQVLVSSATARLTQGQLPAGASLKDLGSHELKDLSAPERVWQLAHPRLPGVGDGAVDSALSSPRGQAYVLTDHLNHDGRGREWGERVTHTAADVASDAIRAYVTPTVAGLLNVLDEGFRLPRLWEASIETDSPAGSAVFACSEATTRRPATLPTLTGLHHARFAVLCARSASENGKYATEFKDWAASWLAGEDSSGTHARELADALDSEARPGSDTILPHPMMLANAARAAGHASKLSWLAGRARDEENGRAISCAAEAVHTALRMAQLDLVTLAEQAVPRQTSPVTPLRTPSVAGANRILRALPT